MAAADAAPVGGLELVGGLAAGQEGGEPGPDRPRAEHRHLRDMAVAEPLVPFGDEAEMVVGAFDGGLAVADGDDRGGDRQRVEIALADVLEDRDELVRGFGGDVGLARGLLDRCSSSLARPCRLHGRGDKGTGLTLR